jgi:hypothetical protein
MMAQHIEEHLPKQAVVIAQQLQFAGAHSSE